MIQTAARDALIDRLPPVRGRLTAGAPLADVTWFRVGGPAEVLFRPADADDLADFLKALPVSAPVTVIGVGSNLLVRDGGVRGVVIRLAGPAFMFTRAGGMRVEAGAAALDQRVAEAAAEAGIDGLSFLRGIPGTVGGAVAMNAGCYGAETKDVLVSAQIVTRAGERMTVTPESLGMAYRRGNLPDGAIAVSATFAGQPGDPAAIRARMAEITAQREASQPVRTRTGGSTFKNPPGESAWALVDRAGCRGLRHGAAQVSELHCNFLLNHGGATAAEIEALGETVRTRVLEATGIRLEWEIRRIGEVE